MFGSLFGGNILSRITVSYDIFRPRTWTESISVSLLWSRPARLMNVSSSLPFIIAVLLSASG